MNNESMNLNRILSELRKLPNSPCGEHLSEGDFIGYAMGWLEPQRVARLDPHLASCPDCACELEQLMEPSAFWTSAEARQRVEALQEAVLAAAVETTGGVSSGLKVGSDVLDALDEAVAKFLKRLGVAVMSFVPKKSFGANPKALRLESEDGLFRAYLTPTEHGDLSISVASHKTCFENKPASIVAGAKRWTASFRNVKIKGQDRVVTELIIKHDELVALPEGSVLRAEFDPS